MTSYYESIEKRRAVEQAEKEGKICDSGAVRLQLMEKVYSGEITLAEAQQKLKQIKKDGKKNGMQTRNDVFKNS